MSFMKNLPSSNPQNFAQMQVSNKWTDGEPRVSVAHQVPVTSDEKKIINDKKPYIAQYLERLAKLSVNSDRAQSPERGSTLRKRKDDEPGTSSPTKKNIRLTRS